MQSCQKEMIDKKLFYSIKAPKETENGMNGAGLFPIINLSKSHAAITWLRNESLLILEIEFKHPKR